MEETQADAVEIKDTDIVFDCPHCNKSLVIDYRGAGLTTSCTDCGEDVVVPIPEGMDISDIENTREDQEMRILNLRKSLAVAEAHIAVLESEVEALSARREVLEQGRAEGFSKLAAILEKAGVIEAAVKDVSVALEGIAEHINED